VTLPPCWPRTNPLQYPSRASVTQQLMYRLGMAERLHLGTAASQQRGVEELAQMGA
jgi:hypothetical protein